MKGADHEQDWQHKCRRLLEDCKPGVHKVLCDSISNIFECILRLLYLILDHLRDDVVRLVELELEFLAEDYKAQSDSCKD